MRRPVAPVLVLLRAQPRLVAPVFDPFGGSPQAYLGTTVAGFPNLFLLTGPNTGLGHNSIVHMLESQFTYVLDALRHMRERGVGVLEVREDAQRAFNEELRAGARPGPGPPAGPGVEPLPGATGA